MQILSVARVPPVVASSDTTVFQAVQIMAQHGVGAIAIVDHDHKVLGIFTERDNMMRVTLKRRDPEKTLLREVMSAPVQTATAETSPAEALEHMMTSQFRHLPVVDGDNRIIGVVSVRQLLLRKCTEQASN